MWNFYKKRVFDLKTFLEHFFFLLMIENKDKSLLLLVLMLPRHDPYRVPILSTVIKSITRLASVFPATLVSAHVG